jgi:hypothetical protein
MVMKTFGKRNFMQQWEGPSMHSRRLVFFLFMFWGGGAGGKIFFHFFRLLNVFALCSFQVPNGFLVFSPTFSPYLFTFICLGKWCPPFTYIGGPKGRNCTVQNRAFRFGESPLFQGVLFFSFKFGAGGGEWTICFIFPLFQQVPNVFLMGFLLSFRGGWERGRFFSFSLYSNRFPMCSPWVFF